MTKTAYILASDFGGDLVAAKSYAERVARAYSLAGQSVDAIDYERAAESLGDCIRTIEASAQAGSFDLGATL